MADNVPITSGAGTSIATDDIGGTHYQIIKLAFGALDSAILVGGANGLPVSEVSKTDTTASGTIAAVSQNVALALNGKSGATIQITGTWTGTLQFEGTVDGTNWSGINGVFAGTSTPGSTITANGIVRLTPSGLAQFRITSTAWTSGTATISMRASDATGGTFLNQSLTAGTNIIGKVGIDQTTPGTTNLVAAVGNVASAATDSGNPVKIGGIYQLTASAATDGQRINALFNSSGALHVSLSGLTQAPTDTLANASYSNIPGNQNVGSVPAMLGHVWNGTNAIIMRGTISGIFMQGPVASGTAKGGNPVQIGGVFNTTQPTVTTGQVVEAQATARGAQIVATGADMFNVTVNAALPTGANVIGALTANQSVNVSQMNGVAVAMGSGVTGTGVQRVVLATDVALPAPAAPAATYSASIVGLATALTATDIFTITGSATKTIRVSKILINGVQTTAAQINVLIIKRSTANSAGTSTAPTRVPYDSASAAATATVLAYTANPTTGTAVGTGSAIRVFVPGAATASDAQGLVVVSGDVGQQMMTLRGIAEVLAVNLNSTTVTGSVINVTVEWTES